MLLSWTFINLRVWDFQVLKFGTLELLDLGFRIIKICG